MNFVSVCISAQSTRALRVCRRRSFRAMLLTAAIALLSLPCHAQQLENTQIQPTASVPMPATTQEQRPSLHSRTQTNPNILIGSGDLLSISVFDVPELSGKFRVEEDGSLSYPLLGVISAGGSTVTDFAVKVQNELRQKKLLNDPQVSVQISEFGTQGITVGGEIQKPGIFPALGSKRLYDVIALGGGLNAQAGNTVTIFRRGEAKGTQVSLQDSSGLPAATNISLYPGDTIIVQKAGTFYVLGDVQKPGGFIIDRPNISVLQALSVAQGPTKTAQLAKARILRKVGNTYQDFPVDIRPLLKGGMADLELRDGDVLYVPESGLRNFYQNSTQGLVGTLASASIYALNR